MNNATIAARTQARDELPVLSQPAARLEWRWMALICLLLVISGVVRYGRDGQFQSLSRESEAPPFPLSEFPKEIGSWRMKEDSEETLEPDIARIAGASDHMVRTYVDESSGQSAVVMILYGLAAKVFPHVPEVCYPANGFVPVSGAKDIEIQVPGTAIKAPFHTQSFVRYAAGERDYREVYHSFRNAGAWEINQSKNWKTFRYHPGMFKVQVQYQGSSSDVAGENDSVKQLLGLVVGEIERRVADKN